jgi:hypothetical protein
MSDKGPLATITCDFVAKIAEVINALLASCGVSQCMANPVGQRAKTHRTSIADSASAANDSNKEALSSSLVLDFGS